MILIEIVTLQTLIMNGIQWNVKGPLSNYPGSTGPCCVDVHETLKVSTLPYVADKGRGALDPVIHGIELSLGFSAHEHQFVLLKWMQDYEKRQ